MFGKTKSQTRPMPLNWSLKVTVRRPTKPHYTKTQDKLFAYKTQHKYPPADYTGEPKEYLEANIRMHIDEAYQRFQAELSQLPSSVPESQLNHSIAVAKETSAQYAQKQVSVFENNWENSNYEIYKVEPPPAKLPKPPKAPPTFKPIVIEYPYGEKPAMLTEDEYYDIFPPTYNFAAPKPQKQTPIVKQTPSPPVTFYLPESEKMGQTPDWMSDLNFPMPQKTKPAEESKISEEDARHIKTVLKCIHFELSSSLLLARIFRDLYKDGKLNDHVARIEDMVDRVSETCESMVAVATGGTHKVHMHVNSHVF